MRTTLRTRLVWGLEEKVSPRAELDQLRGAGSLSGRAYFPGLRVAVAVFARLGSVPLREASAAQVLSVPHRTRVSVLSCRGAEGLLHLTQGVIPAEFDLFLLIYCGVLTWTFDS